MTLHLQAYKDCIRASPAFRGRYCRAAAGQASAGLDQQHMPLVEALRKRAQLPGAVPFHIPGHKACTVAAPKSALREDNEDHPQTA